MVKKVAQPGSPTTISTNLSLTSKDFENYDEGIVPNNLSDTFNDAAEDDDNESRIVPSKSIEDPRELGDNFNRNEEENDEINNDISHNVDETKLSSDVEKLNTDDTMNLEMELNAAVNRALQYSDSESVSNDYDDDASVVSEAQSVSSVKSAVQMRLESRKKIVASAETLQTKMEAAEQRRLYFLQKISGNLGKKFEKISTSKLVVDEQKETKVSELKNKNEEKLSRAVSRKEDFLNSKSSQLRNKLEKVSSTRTVVEEQKSANVEELKKKHEEKLSNAVERKEHFLQKIAVKTETELKKVSNIRNVTEKQEDAETLKKREKLEEKLARAAERKEYFIQSKTSQLRNKIERITSARTIAEDKEEARILALKDKHEKKISGATERKETLIQHITGKVEAKLEKISSARSGVEEQKDADLQSIIKKHDEKQSSAVERKENFLSSKTSQLKRKMEKVSSTRLLKTSEDSQSSLKKDELDRKLSSAAVRKQELLDQKTNKVTAYLASAFDRGQEALKKKRLRDNSKGKVGESLDFLDDAGLMWMNDDSSIARSVTSTSSTKSNVQIRLEGYKRSKPTREAMDEKLHAAWKRRELAVESTKRKAGFTKKMDKVSAKMQEAEAAVKELSARFSDKMQAATKRKKEYMEVSVTGKALQERKKYKLAAEKQAAKSVKRAELQGKLEAKLLAAIERKEIILAEKATKAGGDVSVSAEQGIAAINKKENTVDQLKMKSQKKLISAAERRQELRKLEEEKKEVVMLRREMARSIDADNKMVSVQDMLKSKVDDKFKAAEDRRAKLAEGKRLKKEKREKRRQVALEFSRQRKREAEEIAAWEANNADEQGSLAPVEEDTTLEASPPSDSLTEVSLDDGQIECQNEFQNEDMTIEERRLMAKEQLVNEIRLANEAKYNELDRIRRDMKSVKRPDSALSFGTIESTEELSFDEGDVSISGLSAIREEESSAEKRKSRAALALAELDIKLSEIQILQAMLLAEEASVSGASEFKTSEKSVQELEQVDLSAKRNEKKPRRRFQFRAKKILSSTMEKAKEAQFLAGRTMKDLKRNVVEFDKKRKVKSGDVRPSTAPSTIEFS